jgi:hypothetical protein
VKAVVEPLPLKLSFTVFVYASAGTLPSVAIR